MVKSKSRQFINLILVLILFSAPIEVLFAGAHVTPDAEIIQTIDRSTDMHSVHVESMEGLDHHQSNSLDQDCEKQCVNCVFCSAAMLSYYSSNEKLHAVNIPRYNNSLVDMVTDVDIRPPKYFTSI